jgi:hypothetical protein
MYKKIAMQCVREKLFITLILLFFSSLFFTDAASLMWEMRLKSNCVHGMKKRACTVRRASGNWYNLSQIFSNRFLQ